MRRLRVSDTMRRQLAGLRDARGNVRRGGVMVVPPMLPCDEWEQLAGAQQDALIAASAEDRTKPYSSVVTKHESKDEAALRAHRDSEALYQQAKREQPQVVRAYLKAQGPTKQ